MASPNLSEIVTTTLRNRSGKLADNVTKSRALLDRLKKKGNNRPSPVAVARCRSSNTPRTARSSGIRASTC
jgi:hypothetical protein